MTEEKEKLFSKIRALLRQAEGTSYEEEARAFYEKAQELMLAYSVSEEELWESEPEKREHPTTIVFDIPANKAGVMSKRVILSGVARANNCRAWYEGGTMTVAGYKSDLLFVDMLYTSIQLQMGMALAIGLAKDIDDPRAFRTSFLDGYSRRIYHRLMATRKHVVEETNGNSTSTALALLSREAAIEKYVEEVAGKLHSASRSSRISSSEGYYAGKDAANKADISGGGNQISGTRRQLPSS